LIYQSVGKRIFDLVAALIAGIFFFPFIVIGYLLVRLSSPGPGFFVQERLGYKGRMFRVYKLRTMQVRPDREITQTTNADPEVFFVGKVLRRLKIDELPQIFNVIKGDMSIVGPRPGLPRMASEMPAWAKARLEVRPGLTGLAQVNGNIALSWEERWKYDVKYIAELSLVNDLCIIMRTMLVIFAGESRFRKAP